MRTVVCVCGWYSSRERANEPNHGHQADGSSPPSSVPSVTPEVGVGRCGRIVRPFSGRRVHYLGTSWGVSSQNRAYPTQKWPASGGGRRSSMRWRSGAVVVSEIERYPI